MKLRNLVSPEKKQFAKKLRRHMTAAEFLLWSRVRNRRLSGLKFRRQVVIRGYIADFYCPEHKLIVEVDGIGHNPQADALRDLNILSKTGISTLRFSNSRVFHDTRDVLQTIVTYCLGEGYQSPERFSSTYPQHSSSSSGSNE